MDSHRDRPGRHGDDGDRRVGARGVIVPLQRAADAVSDAVQSGAMLCTAKQRENVLRGEDELFAVE